MSMLDTVVIGAGQAGLAVSRLLMAHGRDHVVLDRGRIGESWRTRRWDSLHLLTPNWMCRLPSWEYSGPDPDGYLSAGELVRHLEGYADSFLPPLQLGTTVLHVGPTSRGVRVDTDRGTWHARHLVIATGPGDEPHRPPGLDHLDPDIEVIPASQYRNPDRVPDGGVLVVGSSASGVQIADELSRAGRQVTLAVGGHTRMPRRYRGMDIFWWLEHTGRLARTVDDVRDPVAARREPSLQLIGRPEGDPRGADVDLGVLQARGVRLTGRVAWINGARVTFRDDLATTVGEADARLRSLLDGIDRSVSADGLEHEVLPATRPAAVRPLRPSTTSHLRSEGVGTVVLATGFRAHYPWLGLPILDGGGRIEQYRGRTRWPGVFVVGQRFQYRRDSSFIDGVRHDAATVVADICASSGSSITSSGARPAGITRPAPNRR
jgi:putative flavoprotein involved in K+ transport